MSQLSDLADPAPEGGTVNSFFPLIRKAFAPDDLRPGVGQLADVLGLDRTFLCLVVVPYLLNAALWFVFYATCPRDVARYGSLDDAAADLR